MPLLRRKAFVLAKPPDDLNPNELIFQVRFTKEVFRDYEEYLKRLNLYRQRVWTCRVTGKTNLTYEKALVSEHKASQRITFPKEFMGPVLHMVQFSELGIEELVDHIYKVFNKQFVVGEEVSGWHRESLFRCKIVKTFLQNDGNDRKTYQYEVAWLDDDSQIIENSVECAKNLVRNKHPFSKAGLKVFIEDSAFGELKWDMPWLVRDKLAQRYKIPLYLPAKKKRSHSRKVLTHCDTSHLGRSLRDYSRPDWRHTTWKRSKKRTQSVRAEKPNYAQDRDLNKGSMTPEFKAVCYPIDDNLVQPSGDDPPFTERPMPSSEFELPIECIGNLLMVWDFCMSFAKNLQLSPFTLDDFEKALNHRDSDPSLLAETNYALLRAALTDSCLHGKLLQKRKRKIKISLETWKETLCDLLEIGPEKFTASISLVRENAYRQLEPSLKLEIMHELVDWALRSQAIRGQLEENIEEQQAIASQQKGSKLKRKWEQVSCSKQVFPEQADGILTSRITLSGGIPKEGSTPFDEDAEHTDCIEQHAQLMVWSRKGKRKSNGSHTRLDEIAVASGIGNGTSHSASKLRHAFFRPELAVLIVDKVEEKTRQEEQKKAQEKRRTQVNSLAEKLSQKQDVVISQKKKEQLDREMEKCLIRTSPLGRDRNFNQYWFFPREGRVFVENEDSSKWGFYSSKEEIDALVNSLNPKGVREKSLQRQLEKHRIRISTSLHRRSKEVLQRFALEEASLRRSLRVRTAPKPTGFLAYVNKYRSNH